ncbi:MAG: tyrosine-type recombinase/integrase, partial [Chloroflexi bacterium]|nr:tyrosine-type recombinase/integrase [Chloroflexota bacterium]
MPEAVPTSLSEVIDAYLADCVRRGLRPTTLRGYGADLGILARHLGGPAVLADLTLRTARDAVDVLGQRRQAGSVAGFVRVLRTFSTWCVDEGLLASDPLARLKAPRVDRKTIDVPTDHEIAAMTRTADPLGRLVIAILTGTGMRVGELCALDLDDVRPDCLVIRSAKAREGRVVPLDPALRAELDTWLRFGRPQPLPLHARALLVTRTKRRASPDVIRHALRRISARAGIEGISIHPHLFRHWFARDLVAHDTPTLVIAARGGWKTLSVLQRYAVVGPNEVRRDVERYSPAERLAAMDGARSGGP